MGGTAFARIDGVLKPCSHYIDHRHGAISVLDYQKWIEKEGSNTYTELNQDQINLSARFPHDKHDFVRRALSQCRSHNLVPTDRYDAKDAERALATVDAGYQHGTNMTYIFPEEDAFLYALVRNMQPRRAVFMGSYYGYWAAAAKNAHPELEITLVDIDAGVMNLAQQNFETLGQAHKADFVIGDAEGVVSAMEDIDLLVLDAEGPKSDEVPPDYRDKAIYYPHLKSAMQALSPGALVVMHNVILSNFTDGAYFEGKQGYYRKQYVKLLPLLEENFSYTIVDSTEGMLIARKRDAGN